MIKQAPTYILLSFCQQKPNLFHSLSAQSNKALRIMRTNIYLYIFFIVFWYAADNLGGHKTKGDQTELMKIC